jgi:uroporphyrinogen decarboxylase
MALTGYERTARILKHQKTDRIGLYEHFWNDTHKSYVDGGYIKPEESFEDHFDYDMREGGWPTFTIDLDFVPEVVEETEDTVLTKDGNGAFLRRHKKHDSTPEHVDFSIKSRKEWDEVKEKLTNFDDRRVPYDSYRKARKDALEKQKFFFWNGVGVFELMHPICGHEYMLMGMALDPDWILDMCAVLSNLTVQIQQTLFEKEGYPDGIWFYEDMGFKERPFMSPAMYKELIFPAHKKTMDYAHSKNLPVVVHSCGFIEPLLPHMIEAGMDALQVIEIKAGMDLLRINKNFGDKIALIGGIDVREIYSNDKSRIDRELESKIPEVMKNCGFVLHSDHSIPNTVHYDTLKYFIEKGLELGTYT